MGSFAYTCAISSLPIEAGDPVRFICLQQNPFSAAGKYADEETLWYMRLPPIRARYNDYGSVEDIEPEDEAIVKLWLDSFNRDIVEMGVGDNTVHDVAVRREMSFHDLCEALQERRVYVRRELDPERYAGMGGRPKIPKGVPTLRRVEKAIAACVEKPEAYIVDKVRKGEVRVRLAGYHRSDEALGVLAGKLGDKYAVMHTCGSDGVGRSELRVCPKPGTALGEGMPDHVQWRFRRRDRGPTRLAVRQAMVREDVWQAMLSLSPERYGKDHKMVRDGVAMYRCYAREAWEKYRAKVAGLKDPILRDARWDALARDMANPVAYMVTPMHGTNPSVGAFGLDAAWRMMAGRSDLTEAQATSFLDIMGDAGLVHEVMSVTRMAWRPSNMRGPQFGEWREHEALLTGFLACAKAGADKERKQVAEWSDDA